MLSLQQYRDSVNSRLADHHHARKAFREERKLLAELEDVAADTEEAQRIIQLVAQTVQQRAHDRIAGVVSRCLTAVFAEAYEFRILFEQKRGRTEARLVFVKGDQEVDPLSASGGGVVDVAAFALRLSCILLSRPAQRRLMVVDEPFRFVSVRYRERVRVMLENLAQELGMQFIIITHMPELQFGTIIEL